MLKGKTIVIGVSGGIAAYKVCDVVSKLRKLEATVRVIMTEAATQFVTPLTFQSLSQQPVAVEMFHEISQWDIEHIALAKAADLFLVAPATANIIGKMAHGIADDMLSTTVMATKAPILIAPAMNTNMYENPIVQANMRGLTEYGYSFIEPDSGRLACGDIGKGKLAQPEKIVGRICEMLIEDISMKGLKVLITSGPTREAIDPVRYLTNHSSGKMGYALAKAAVSKGAEVTLISGPVSLEQPKGLKFFVQVETALEMFQVVKEKMADQHIIIKSAAVADYRPKKYENQKIKKSDEDFTLQMTRNPDILKWIGMHKEDHQLIVGFAAETNDVMENGVKKLEAKQADCIIINDITRADAGFGTDTNKVTMVHKSGSQESLPVMSKDDLSHVILDHIMEMKK